MALKKLRPTTPTTRHTILVDKRELSKEKPEKSLLGMTMSDAGRNNMGRVTVRHQGGGVKRRYRIVDFKRDKENIEASVARVEYDPNRNARIALLHYKDGEKRYILAPSGLNVGDTVQSGEEANIQVGNALPLKNIPLGTFVHNVELSRGRGGQMARSAGSAMQLQARDAGYVQLKAQSGEVRLVKEGNYATIGRVGNEDHSNQKLGKAGRNRYKGIRPGVRGMAMHAEQHPHGGGESRGHVGGKSKDLWGNRRGKITRWNKKADKYIVQRRNGRKVKRK